ncbi:hypothetical protein [Leptolyngbya ohadii]|uniref:hypothetical protein n=1 Tax=Leptolyngbya ohadii TaxID=1962290 RepID=UPI000B5A0794|nr:hypothetical protein [Leptolyngbya ohadii]
MLKFVAAVAATALISSTAPLATATPRWEYQGTAVTGERVYLDLNSIRFEGRRGYFFDYRIGNDFLDAYTPCDGRWQVADSNGVFSELMLPQSEATQRMLDRVCGFR